MDTSDNAGEPTTRGQLLPHPDLLRRSLTEDECEWMWWYRNASHLGAERFTELAQALSQGDIAYADTLLRGWGVRQ